jgi:hypothetical protein
VPTKPDRASGPATERRHVPKGKPPQAAQRQQSVIVLRQASQHPRPNLFTIMECKYDV